MAIVPGRHVICPSACAASEAWSFVARAIAATSVSRYAWPVNVRPNLDRPNASSLNNKPRYRKMDNHTPKRIPAESEIAGNGLDLTEIFRSAGLPHQVFASARFAAHHQLSRAAYERCEHYALIWSIRCALTDCLPARRTRTPRGELLLIEYPGFAGGSGQDETVRVAILLPTPGIVRLFLPEELEITD